MATLPPVIFQVTFTVPAEMRWAMRAKGEIDAWLMSDAASERPIDQLPATDLTMELDHSELSLSWLELQATNAWQAVMRASQIVDEILPELLRTRTLRIEATLQGPDPACAARSAPSQGRARTRAAAARSSARRRAAAAPAG